MRIGLFGAPFAILLAWAVPSPGNCQINQQEGLISGTMLPAHDPTPTNSCPAGMPQRGVLLLLGNSAFATYIFPHVVLRVAGIDRIIINEGADTGIALTTDIFSADGTKLAALEENNFSIFTDQPNHSLKMDRPDKSTLIISDETGQKILDARYINATTFRLQGNLHFPGADFVAESGNLIVGNHNQISHMCIQGSGTDIVIN